MAARHDVGRLREIGDGVFAVLKAVLLRTRRTTSFARSKVAGISSGVRYEELVQGGQGEGLGTGCPFRRYPQRRLG